MSIIGGKGASEHVLGVADKSSGGSSLLKIPKSEFVIPGGSEGISAILRKAEIFNEVGVSY